MVQKNLARKPVEVVTGFAIITWNNPKKLEKPCITKGLATCQSLGLIFSCNKVLMLDAVLVYHSILQGFNTIPGG